MTPNEVQSVIQLEPPYGTTLVQHLHHAELLFAKKDAKTVIDWIHNLNLQALAVIYQLSDKNSQLCTSCKDGFIVDSSRVSEVFPGGFPMKCPACNGTSLISNSDDNSNDIISDTIPPQAIDNVSVIHVEKET